MRGLLVRVPHLVVVEKVDQTKNNLRWHLAFPEYWDDGDDNVDDNDNDDYNDNDVDTLNFLSMKTKTIDGNLEPGFL